MLFWMSASGLADISIGSVNICISILDGRDDRKRAALIAEQLMRKSGSLVIGGA
jgi:hypothetical protein